ncbi:High-affinity heme uptake system protein IsdE precursor [Polystyrenella longa]|uniref:High-affinity heme uptake system protein IsdE n=1 Tax=Polystyrenella longa TaxID=2528007 RepID=A0A518CMB0_9PLAN|nr:cobalamin-binding protein [Polystyrenella longa]QDU80369.1 High-affinity heme uptake system protein IsdE precursor [Polystyrenella longa]
MKRIVSLLPAATEIVYALGCGANLVGRSHECDYPAAVQMLPVCTLSRIDASQSGTDIHENVTDLLREGESLYEVDYELIKSLQPDVVITQAQCEVCAISYVEVACELSPLIQKGIELVSMEVYRLADLWKQVRSIASSLACDDTAERWIQSAEERIDRIARQQGANTSKPRVACIEWFDPLMAAGNWVPEMVELAGGVNVLGQPGEHSPWMNWEELLAVDPDVIVLLPCGFDLERSRKEAETLLQNEHWSQLRAVKNDAVYVTDGSQFFNRPGPRLVNSIEILAEILHPEAIKGDHQGIGWSSF